MITKKIIEVDIKSPHEIPHAYGMAVDRYMGAYTNGRGDNHTIELKHVTFSKGWRGGVCYCCVFEITGEIDHEKEADDE